MELENQDSESDETIGLRLAVKLAGCMDFLEVLNDAAEDLLEGDIGFGLILYDRETRSGIGWRTNAPHRSEIVPILKRLVANLETERKCKVCGCTEDKPCVYADGSPCEWVAVDLCSACVPKTAALVDASGKPLMTL
jgi:hypothetical protein